MDSDTWCTPRSIALPLEQFFGGAVDVDPCSNERSIIKAKKVYTWGGLTRRWGRTTYENPPYSCTHPWTVKGFAEMGFEAGHQSTMQLGGRASGTGPSVDELVRLVMVSTSSAWWTLATSCPRNPRLLFTKRLKFIGDAKNGARFDTVLMYYGKKIARVRAFEREFKSITRWSTWGST